MAELNLALPKQKDTRCFIYKGKFPDVAGTKVDRSSRAPYSPPNYPLPTFCEISFYTFFSVICFLHPTISTASFNQAIIANSSLSKSRPVINCVPKPKKYDASLRDSDIGRSLILAEDISKGKPMHSSLGSNAGSRLRLLGWGVDKQWDEFLDSLLGGMQGHGSSLLDDSLDKVKDGLVFNNGRTEWKQLESLQLLLGKACKGLVGGIGHDRALN